jgi:hyperosmotically inducible protein
VKFMEFMEGLKVDPLAALLAALCALACSTSMAQSEPQQSSDAETTTRVKAGLSADTNLFAKHIDVAVRDGVVHLKGFVATDQELQQAQKDARSVPGVTSVRNEMQVKRGESRGNGT